MTLNELADALERIPSDRAPAMPAAQRALLTQASHALRRLGEIEAAAEALLAAACCPEGDHALRAALMHRIACGEQVECDGLCPDGIALAAAQDAYVAAGWRRLARHYPAPRWPRTRKALAMTHARNAHGRYVCTSAAPWKRDIQGPVEHPDAQVDGECSEGCCDYHRCPNCGLRWRTEVAQ